MSLYDLAGLNIVGPQTSNRLGITRRQNMWQDIELGVSID